MYPRKKLVYIKHFPLTCQEIFANSGLSVLCRSRPAGRTPSIGRTYAFGSPQRLQVLISVTYFFRILRCSLHSTYSDSSETQRIYTTVIRQLQQKSWLSERPGALLYRFHLRIGRGIRRAASFSIHVQYTERFITICGFL